MSDAVKDHSPIKPARLLVKLNEDDSQLTVRYRKRQWGVAFFLTFWLCGWTAGCLFLAYQIWTKPEVFLLVFAIPFWTSWLFVAGLLLSMLLRKEVLVLDETGAVLTKSLLFPISRRFVPLAELKCFESIFGRSGDADSAPVNHIKMVTLGQPLQTFADLPHDERAWLVWRLNHQLKVLNPHDDDDPRTPSSRRTDSVEPPSDNSWKLIEDYDSISFVQRGKLQLSAVMGALFIALFWNGIVSVFVMVLLGVAPGGPARFSGEWWGLFLFLIPFEAIGLLILCGFLLTILEPIRRTMWRFEQYEIRYYYGWLGIGYRRRYDNTAVAEVNLDQDDANAKNSTVPQQKMLPAAMGNSRLRFVDDQNTEIVSISGLTEGEALWIRDNLRRQHSDWFRT